jgi:hypothetical protein
MKALQQTIAMAAMAGSLCVAGAAAASEPANPPKSATQMSAMRVMVDPETGEVRAPTDEELRALIAAEKAATQAQKPTVARSAAATAQQVLPAQKSVVRHKNGMVSVQLSQDTLSAIKVETDATGRTHLVHEGQTLKTAEDK